MGIVNYTYNRSTSGGEIITHLINASDGEGLHFDGAAGKVAFTAPDFGEKYSLEFIVSGDAITGVLSLLDIWDSVGSKRLQFAWSGNTDGQLQLAINGTWATAFGATPANGEPVHLVVAVDGTSATLYQNGNVLSTQTVIANTLTSATNAAVGSNFNGTSEFFNGTLYRTRFWNKALTQAEVTASYENATVPFADQYGSQTDLIVNGAFAADTNWTKQTGWTIGSGVAHCATTDDYALYQAADNQTIGKKYRITFTISNYVSGGVTVDDDYGAGKTLYAANGTFTEEFTSATVTTSFFGQNSVTSNLDIDNVSVVEIGCVADYDLAFANPTQSLMVQDRAGNADGTSSATGVVQVTPIEQLNSKALSVGTTAATPADGELLVSGKIGIGDSSPGSLLEAAAASNPRISLFRKDADINNTERIGDIHFQGSDVGSIATRKTSAIIRGMADGDWNAVNDYQQPSSLNFYTQSASSTVDGLGSPRLTIDSAGLVTVAAGIVSSAMPTSDPAVTGQLWNDSGTVKISSG